MAACFHHFRFGCENIIVRRARIKGCIFREGQGFRYTFAAVHGISQIHIPGKIGNAVVDHGYLDREFRRHGTRQAGKLGQSYFGFVNLAYPEVVDVDIVPVFGNPVQEYEIAARHVCQRIAVMEPGIITGRFRNGRRQVAVAMDVVYQEGIGRIIGGADKDLHAFQLVIDRTRAPRIPEDPEIQRVHATFLKEEGRGNRQGGTSHPQIIGIEAQGALAALRLAVVQRPMLLARYIGKPLVSPAERQLGFGVRAFERFFVGHGFRFTRRGHAEGGVQAGVVLRANDTYPYVVHRGGFQAFDDGLVFLYRAGRNPFGSRRAPVVHFKRSAAPFPGDAQARGLHQGAVQTGRSRAGIRCLEHKGGIFAAFGGTHGGQGHGISGMLLQSSQFVPGFPSCGLHLYRAAAFLFRIISQPVILRIPVPGFRPGNHGPVSLDVFHYHVHGRETDRRMLHIEFIDTETAVIRGIPYAPEHETYRRGISHQAS